MDNNMGSIVEEPFLPSHSSDIVDNFGDPEVLPRVGDQYQVEIPSLMIRKPTDTELKCDVQNYFTMALPIPIVWVHNEVENIKEAVNINEPVGSENSEESQITSNNADAEFNFEQENETKLDNGDKGYCLVPGTLGDAWRDIEYNSFLLGLYIFGKNLHLVKKFVESKEMGDILCYYYGKFYRSRDYLRWSECRKMRSRRCIHGQRIFTGWRQHELLSRLFSHVSEESKNKLTEVSRTFGEGKLSLEEYVFTLKDMVGINMLVEEVAIGKGKQDLTGTSIEPTKTNYVYTLRPEIPSGKACSSLTSGEIIKFLTGNFRLSKARSNDLFWEAVWPRLLARGWHSEQPRDRSLVFLIPGIKKFSRRKLVKGNHYFDSVSDVLNKVASEPGLLELEFEATKVSTQEEEYRTELDPDMNKDPDIFSNRRRHCYLQPHISNCSRDSVKFTVVDTSLIRGEERVKVRELRSLPVDPKNVSTLSSLSSETEQNKVEESQDEAEESICCSNSPNTCNNMAFQVGLDQNNDSGTDEPVENGDLSPNKSSSLAKTSKEAKLLNPSTAGDSTIEQETVLNGRRQSTRNRPLTTRALEALACGFLGTKRKRKGMEAISRNNSIPRSSRMVRAKNAVGTTRNGGLDNDVTFHKMDEEVDLYRVDEIRN